VTTKATALYATFYAVLLSGCASTPRPVEVRVAIPVECKERVPDRPAMPTETLQVDAPLDTFVQAVTAEIERREGYEVELRAALTNCIKPMTD